MKNQAIRNKGHQDSRVLVTSQYFLMCQILCLSTSHTLSHLIFKQSYEQKTKTWGSESLNSMFKLTEPVGAKNGILILVLPIPMPLLSLCFKAPVSPSFRSSRYSASKNTWKEPMFTKMSKLQARSDGKALRSQYALWGT